MCIYEGIGHREDSRSMTMRLAISEPGYLHLSYLNINIELKLHSRHPGPIIAMQQFNENIRLAAGATHLRCLIS